MKFKAKISSNSISLILLAAMLVGISVSVCISAFSWKLLALALLLTIPFAFFLIPMFFMVSFVFEAEGLRAGAGPLPARRVAFKDIYGYQLAGRPAEINYGFAGEKVAIYYKDRRGEDAVMTFSPRYINDFLDALRGHTGLEITPADPSYDEIQRQFNKDITPAQRRAARRRLFRIVKDGYVDEVLEAKSAQSLREKVQAAAAEKGATDGAPPTPGA